MPLRIAIIEDEPATARHLRNMLQDLDPEIEVLKILGGVGESVDWLSANKSSCELLFMDIRLNDGQSFEIFDKVNLEMPVIFVTAFNDFALQAFKTNGIDYILKPFDDAELGQALAKFKRLRHHAPGEDQLQRLREIAGSLKSGGSSYKQSFLVPFRDKLVPLKVEEITWFYTSNELVQAQTVDNKKFNIDSTLEELQEMLDPQQFFRANRQFIVHRNAIREIELYFNSRLVVKMNPDTPENVVISKARVAEFKAWMNA